MTLALLMNITEDVVFSSARPCSMDPPGAIGYLRRIETLLAPIIKAANRNLIRIQKHYLQLYCRNISIALGLSA
jgi:hypothetical protein